MATAPPDLDAHDPGLKALIVRVNDHPDVRLKLLAEVTQTLDDPAGSSPIEHEELADKVERWRYQLLNHNAGRMTDDQLELTYRLDMLVGRLRPEDPHPPRGLQARLQEQSSPPREDEPAWCLDANRPVSAVERAAQSETDRRFTSATAPSSRKMLLYAPLYLSNHCINHCLYCGFRYPNPMDRVHLDTPAALAEAAILEKFGYQHVLVVAGEFPRLVTVEYLTEIVRALSARGLAVAVEVAPQSTKGYRQLHAAGTLGVTLYQETYDAARYQVYHPRGTKAWYDWRLEGPERAAEAGISRIGLGILLGLGSPLAEVRALIAHGRYLLERFPGLKLSLSLPRVHDAPDAFRPPCPVDDETFIRLYCSLRLALPDANLVLSTREPAHLRDRLAQCCITQMSAGSSTSPGGYQVQAAGQESRQQFPICDHRSPDEVATYLAENGFQVVRTLAEF